MTSAWWVSWSQVQRLDGAGGFEARGKKNYLPPAMLVLGYGILWTSEDEETMERHARPLLSESVIVEDEEEVLTVEDEQTVQSEPDKQTLVDEQVNEVEQDTDEQSESGEESMPYYDDAKGEEQDKYNLHEYGSASDDEATGASSISQVPRSTKKQFLSAKQRRDLKKGNPVSTTTPQSASDSDSDVDKVTSSIDTLSVSSKTEPQQPKVRGKKGKMKKLKSKYADQSDEERELVKKLLGARSTSKQPPSPTEKVESKPIVPTRKPPPVPRPPKPAVDEPLEVPPLTPR